jgi:hypothetical protein
VMCCISGEAVSRAKPAGSHLSCALQQVSWHTPPDSWPASRDAIAARVAIGRLARSISVRSNPSLLYTTAAYINAAVFCIRPLPSVEHFVSCHPDSTLHKYSRTCSLYSLDVAVGLWPLLREGLRPSRLRPGALTRPCAS